MAISKGLAPHDPFEEPKEAVSVVSLSSLSDDLVSHTKAASLQSEEWSGEDNRQKASLEEHPPRWFSEDSDVPVLKSKRRSLPDLPLIRASEDRSEDSKEHFPRSYHENNLKEELLIEHICPEFIKSVARWTPRRKRPLLILPNEVGTPKMVCTTVNVSKIHATWQHTAKLLSRHVNYVPLEKPLECPTQLRSPHTVFRSRHAHCLEMSTLLVSLMNGVRLDSAYVVLGYATHEHCVNDQTSKPCPVTISVPSTPVKVERVESDPYLVQLPRGSRYSDVKEAYKDYESKVDKKARLEKEQKGRDREGRLRVEREKGRALMNTRQVLPPDPLYGHRIHSWVLAFEPHETSQRSPTRRNPKSQALSGTPMAGNIKRLQTPFFVEPSSGERYDVNDANYLGILAVWNNKDYWYNRQVCQLGCSKMTYDLNNPKAWKSLLAGRAPETADTSERISQVSSKHSKRTSGLAFQMPFSWTESIFETGRLYNDSFGGMTARRSKYHKTVLDEFQEMAHPLGLVTRVSHFVDVDYKVLKDSTEEYKFRSDQLQYRRVDHEENSIREFFLHGRRDHMLTYTAQVMDGHQEFSAEFDSQQTDGLRYLHACRGRMIHAVFENRPDKMLELYGETVLKYEDDRRRSSLLGEDEREIRPQTNFKPFPQGEFHSLQKSCPHSLFTASAEPLRTLVFARVAYDRNPEYPLNEDVKVMTFFLPMDRIEVDYHSEPSNVMHKRVVITKTEKLCDESIRQHVRYQSENPYESNEMELNECYAAHFRFKGDRGKIVYELGKYMTLIDAIHADQTRRRTRCELLPQTPVVSGILEAQRKVEEIKNDYLKRLYSAL